MASSSFVSNSQHCPRWKYDVFLSFRGEDTRKTFTGHLYEGLKNRGIFTFQDEKRLEHGDSIPEELLKAIEESQIALVVFSKNYATSRWCLNELVKIMECNKDKNGQTVMPVFYDVDPSHVRYQKESFAEAFAEHKLKYKDDIEGMQKMQGWRTALTAAANLKGYDIRDGIESDCIQHIVDQISSKLCKTSVSYLQKIVGIGTHLEKVKSLLEMESNDVRIVGIWGMGGVGKTTIARAIFDTNSDQFDGACFLEDIKENKCGMHTLQNILLSDLLREKENHVYSKEDGKHIIARRLRFKKVLVVLDDIDHRDHLDYLAGDLDWFGKGSRIIATTRDKHLIGKNVVYEVTTLLDHEAIQLFNQYAFKGEVPDVRFYNLSWEVVSHAKGLPLALKVWGSFLHKRSITEWRSAIDRLKKNPSSEIVEKLKISYDWLEPEEQEIFLDIACFLRGEGKDYIMQVLESCDFGADIGLSVLIDKSLVFISGNDTIEMHDLIQDMGRYVVKMQKKSGECSRLWDAEDFEEMMANNTGIKTMEAIWFHHCQKLCFSKEAMKNMRRLRILYIGGFHTYDDSIEYLPYNLRWFDCHKYPWESLPQEFEPKRLVHLNLRMSLLRHLWAGTKHFPSLRMLDLSYSGNLMQTPDFTWMPNLEYLHLSYCSNLEEVHYSLGCSRKIIQMNLKYCKSLKRFPCVSGQSLEYLDLQGCYSLEKFPEILNFGRTKLKLEIIMRGSGIRELPSLGRMKPDLKVIGSFVAFPSTICRLKSLVSLNLVALPSLKLDILPEEIGDLENLEYLEARGSLISQPPPSILQLNKLKFLTFAKQKSEVCLEDGVYFVFPRINEGLRSLENLDLSYRNLIDGGLPEDIGSLSSLKKLNLTGNNFEHLPRSIGQLGALRSLNLSDCNRLKELPSFLGMPNLETLNLSNCMNLEEVHHSLGFLKKLCTLKLTNCECLKRFPALCINSLEYLYLQGCYRLENFPELFGSMKLELKNGIRYLDLSGLKSLVTLPSSICKLKSLAELNMSDCSKLESLPEAIGYLEKLERLDARYTLISQPPPSIVGLNKLKFLSFAKQKSEVCLRDGACFVFPQVNEGLHSLETLNLSYCSLIDRGLPEDIGSLSSLKALYLRGNNFEHLPRSITQLGALLSLDLSDCRRLKELPGFMGMPNLETLNLSNCMNLEEVHHSLGFLKKLLGLELINCQHLKRFPALCINSLEYLYLQGCYSLENFPEILGNVNLEWNNGIRYLDLRGYENLVTLPSSICKFKSLVELDVSNCSKLDMLPEGIGDLENLENLEAGGTLISQPPPSIVRLNKLKFLSFAKQKSEVCLGNGGSFVFPQVNEGLRSLEYLNLSYCNLIDRGLPEDIGSLSSLKALYLRGNNFEHLPRSITQLGALLILDLLDCARLTQLPEFPQQVDTIYSDWSNDSICNSLFQNISSLQPDISASDSLSLRVFTSWGKNIPSWFLHRGIDRSASVILPENWYVRDNFLGFAVCYSGRLIDTIAHLIPLHNDGISWITQKLALSNHSECAEPNIHFFLIPFSGLWDMSKANGRTPDDYGHIMLFFGEIKDFGLRLLRMRENNDEPTEHHIVTRRSRYDSSERHDSVTNEASCSSSKKQKSHF